ncbi:hypothetical protein [Coralloluteibacterium stylophorae]|uniref:Uncharacterized protein n=1 Tax=Coralloluteibacterium stylophorae TaxID=1776034 RepID=A0A8J8AZR0_9GAMM|nr:hypothetical protein [Coralloluteibacterium stylophorae]
MLLSATVLGALALAPFAAHADPACAGAVVPEPRPVRPTGIPAVAMELPAGGSRLGAPSGLMARTADEMQSVDRVLLRLRLEGCQNVSAAAGYQKRTEWDNKPWRFNAGTKFTAADFDAWMKERGITISKAAPAAAPAAAVPAAEQVETQD